MSEKAYWYGDAWLIPAVLSLAGALVIVWTPAVTLWQGVMAVAGALVITAVVGYATASLRNRFDKSTFLFDERMREIVLIGVLIAVIAVPFVAWYRGRPVDIPQNSLTADETGKLAASTTQDADGTVRLSNPQVRAVLERQKTLESRIAANGSDAAAAAKEMKDNYAWLEKVEKYERQKREPVVAGNPQPTNPPPPPMPRVTFITHDEQERELSLLEQLLNGTAGGLIKALLGISGNGGYQKQVQIAVQTMKGNAAATTAQIQAILDAVGGTPDDNRARLSALKDLDTIGEALLDAQQRALLQQRLQVVRDGMTLPLSERILIVLQRNPAATPGELLSYLRNGEFESKAQKESVRRALIDKKFGTVWTEVFVSRPPN